MMTVPAIAEYAGLSYRQVDTWATRGLLHTHGATEGGGIARTFDPSEAQVAKWMALLIRHGLTADAAAGLARGLHQHGRARLGLFDITTASPTRTGAPA